MKSIFSFAVGAILFFELLSANAEQDLPFEPLKPETKKLLLQAVGNPDPFVPHRLALALPANQLKSAIYRGTRQERLLALDAASCFSQPWTILPYVAALMGARDRQVASRATNTLVILLSKVNRKQPSISYEVIPKQVIQLATQLLSITGDARLDVDVRVSALTSVQLLRTQGIEIPIRQEDLLQDDNRAIRRAALATLALPVKEALLGRLAQMSTTDDDLWLRGQAAALLCENAISHGVKKPSRDLVKILKTVIGNAEVPSGAIGPVLSCLNHFPTDSRVDLFDLAHSHPDPSIGEFIKTLQNR